MIGPITWEFAASIIALIGSVVATSWKLQNSLNAKFEKVSKTWAADVKAIEEKWSTAFTASHNAIQLRLDQLRVESEERTRILERDINEFKVETLRMFVSKSDMQIMIEKQSDERTEMKEDLIRRFEAVETELRNMVKVYAKAGKPGA